VKNTFRNSIFSPSIDLDINGASAAEDFGKVSPFAVVFTDIDENVKEPPAIEFYTSPLFWEQTNNAVSLSLKRKWQTMF
jgi:hypothetical protein